MAGLRIVSLRKHAAGGANLDQIRAVLDVLPHALLHGGDAVCHAFRSGVVFRGQEVIIAVTACDAEWRPAHLHMRAGNVACVDIVAQSHVRVAGRADVAHRGESGFERDLRKADAVERFADGIRREAGVGIEVIGESQMRVYVDQTRQHGHATQIDFPVARLRGRGRRCGNRRDPVAGDYDRLVGRFRAGAHVDYMPGANQDSRGLRDSRHCERQR